MVAYAAGMLGEGVTVKLYLFVVEVVYGALSHSRFGFVVLLCQCSDMPLRGLSLLIAPVCIALPRIRDRHTADQCVTEILCDIAVFPKGDVVADLEFPE